MGYMEKLIEAREHNNKIYSQVLAMLVDDMPKPSEDRNLYHRLESDYAEFLDMLFNYHNIAQNTLFINKVEKFTNIISYL